MNYVSVCSGIEAATVAWHPIGWTPLWFSEIAKFPARVLKERFPHVENRGDFTQARRANETCDLLVGGTPCQSFSVAGERAGLDDPRGVLALHFARLARDLRARWVVWENVPGVLSHEGGETFRSILRVMAECGSGFAYRILDAQFFGVPQRRRRVFVVGYLGDWRPAAAALLESHGLRGDPASGRDPRAEVAGTLTGGSAYRGTRIGPDEAGGGHVVPEQREVALALMAKMQSALDPSMETFPVEGGPKGDFGVCFDEAQVTSATNRSRPEPGDPCPTLSATGRPTVALPWAVRRLTPRERERLQGFPDDWTLVPGAKDGPRNAALGNSMAVPVMAWIGRRIDAVDRLLPLLDAAGLRVQPATKEVP